MNPPVNNEIAVVKPFSVRNHTSKKVTTSMTKLKAKSCLRYCIEPYLSYLLRLIFYSWVIAVFASVMMAYLHYLLAPTSSHLRRPKAIPKDSLSSQLKNCKQTRVIRVHSRRWRWCYSCRIREGLSNPQGKKKWGKVKKSNPYYYSNHIDRFKMHHSMEAFINYNIKIINGRWGEGIEWDDLAINFWLINTKYYLA